MKIKPAASLGVAAVAAVLVTVGCSGGSDAGTPASTPKPAPTVTVTATETAEASPSANGGVIAPDSLTDFRDKLTDQGLTCDDWSVTMKNFSGSCSDLVLLTWADPNGDKEDLYQSTLALAWSALRDQERDDVGLLVGSGWFVRLGVEDAKTMRDRVGGVVLHG